MDTLIQDLRYAVRGLLRSPGFTLAVIATLALGIGANTTMFGVLDTLLLKPPAHVRDASRVARAYFRRQFLNRARVNVVTSFPGYESLHGTRAFSALAATAGSQVSIGTGADAQQARVKAVSASFFPLLGVQAERGRFFDSTEDLLGAVPVAVVSHTYWVRQMNGDSGVLRRTLPIGRFVYSVIGVAPENFTGADIDEPDIWLPIRQAAPQLTSAEALTSRNWFWVQVLARLARGATAAGAEGEATLAYRRAALAQNAQSDSGATVLLGPIQAARGPEMMSSDAKVALWVGIVAVAVLLVACANVANLLLARGLSRRTEMAVRAGLGAGRGRLVRQLLVESIVLALAGGAAALLVALWGGAGVRHYLLPRLAAGTSVLDLRVLAFTAAAALVTGLLAGSMPAWQSSRADIASALRSGGRDVSRTRGLVRSALLAIQVALTLVLLVGAGLFVRSLRVAQTLDYGIDLEHLLLADVQQRGGIIARVSRNDSPSGPSDPQSALYLRLREAIRRNPAVVSADVSLGTPYQSSYAVSLRASGRDSLPRLEGGGPYLMAVSSGYFATVGTRILRGRGFTDQDIKGTAPVTVVGQTFARLVWPDRDAIGQCLYVGGNDSTCVQVVGVAADARSRSVMEDKTLMYYVPFADSLAPWPLDGLLIRTRGPARAAQGEVQRALQHAEPNLPFVHVDALLDRVEPQWRSWRLGATMLTAFGLLALIIAALGLYGVTAYGVTQRTQEIGVRVALGAQRRDVIRLSVAQAVRATAIGAAVGMAGAFALGRAVSSLLFAVKPADPTAVVTGVVILLAVAALAAYLPARRAARIDPMVALRYE